LFTGEDLSKNVKEGDDKKNGGGTSAGVGTSYDSSPDRHQGQPREKLFFNISCGVKLLLNKLYATAMNSQLVLSKQHTGVRLLAAAAM
jgi:hypothetical protein